MPRSAETIYRSFNFGKPWEEVSFADVSRVLYGSDKYGKALLLFNRNYPLAGDHVRQEPTQLRPVIGGKTKWDCWRP